MDIPMETFTLRAILASLFEGNPDAVVVYDRDGHLAAANPAASEITGFTTEELLGVPYREHIHHSEAALIEFAFESALRGQSGHLETTIRCKDGRIMPVECHIFPARSDGEIIGVFAQARDIIALRTAELSLGANQQRFRSLFEYHPDGIMELKASAVISRVNVALESVTGFFGEQIVGKMWTDLIAPECRHQAEEAFAKAHRGEANELDAFLLDRLGNRIDVQIKVVPLRVAEQIEGAYAIARNVTAQRAAERAIAHQSERIRELYLVAASRGESPEAQIDATLALGCRIFDFDYAYLTRFENGEAVVLNASGSRTPVATGFRFPRTSPFTRHLADERQTLFVPDAGELPGSGNSPDAQLTPRAYFATKLIVSGRRHGSMIFASRLPRTTALSDVDRDVIALMALFVAAALERAVHAERIEQLAFFDSLTGLPNRVLFNDRIKQALAAAKRYNRGFAVMYVDLDDFKAINDTYGHPLGDLVLKSVADRLLLTLRESDTVARFGGDEFVILQPVVNGAADSADLARKLVGALQTPVSVNGVEHLVHASIGIALYPYDGENADALMDSADRALYRAKHAGRNRWVFYNEETPKADWPGAAR
ncbi:MAG: diguanylate cyclase domain-containing protein [Vulcanimicrobiaceae bacterium]